MPKDKLLEEEGTATIQAAYKMREMLVPLAFIGRLEAIGMTALLEAIDNQLTDEQIALMFDAMRDRFLSIAPRVRPVRRTMNMLRSFVYPLFGIPKETRP